MAESAWFWVEAATLRSVARREEGRHLRRAQPARMPHAAVHDEPPHPVRVRTFRAQAVVAEADAVAELLEQARRAAIGTLVVHG